jgi:hypothetical protein
MEATHMTNKMNQAGRKLESMLMMHDVICDTDSRWAYIQTLSGLLRQVDPKRFGRLQRMGVL